MTLDPDIFDDLFQSCAFMAYVEVASQSGWPPDSERTKRRAYELYEEALADRGRRRSNTFERSTIE